jgi:serine/threonine protein kinase
MRAAGDPCYYVALEHCDLNLSQAVEATQNYVHQLWTTSEQFDERNAPLLFWRARRSIARQLVSGVAFMHRTGMGALRRIYHNNLKPSNILLKNGVVKISEINCYSHSDGPEDGALLIPIQSIATVTDELDKPRLPLPSVSVSPPSPSKATPQPAQSPNKASAPYWDDDQLQQEFVPPMMLADAEEMMRLEAVLSACKPAKEDRTSPVATATGDCSPHNIAALRYQLYKLRAYRDSFALGCLIFYTL